MDLLTVDEINNFLQKSNRIKGPEILSILARLNKQLTYIISTDLGKEIFDCDLKRLEELFVKIYKEKTDDLELAEFRFLRDVRIPYIAEKLRQYLDGIKRVKKVANVG
jgi:ABC-type uncharacterized transport system ATPase subunit